MCEDIGKSAETWVHFIIFGILVYKKNSSKELFGSEEQSMK